MAYLIALITQSIFPPVLVSAFNINNSHLGATPIIPLSPISLAPMILAVAVPCPT